MGEGVRLSELKHYGVLGMKWGVRKDRGRKGKFRERSDKETGGKKTTALLDATVNGGYQARWDKFNKKDKRLADAYGAYMYLYHYNTEERRYRIEMFKNDLKAGKSDQDPGMKDFVSGLHSAGFSDEEINNIDQMIVELLVKDELTEEEYAQLERLTALADALRVRLENNYVNAQTKEEKEYYEKRNSMQKYLSETVNPELHKKAKVVIVDPFGGYSDDVEYGTEYSSKALLKYVYTDPNGKQTMFENEMALLRKAQNDRVKYAETNRVRSRDKNVVSSAPVQVIKSEKPANIGAGERTIKKLLYGSEEDKQRILSDYQRMSHPKDSTSKKKNSGGKAKISAK